MPAVIVDALNDAAAAFYEHLGFVRFQDGRSRLYLTRMLAEQLLPDR